jgi:hypothetical protein
VVYTSGDVANDPDLGAFWALIAADAARRAEAGQRLVTMTATPTRTRQPAMSMGTWHVVDRMTVAVVYSSTPW